MDVQPGHCWRCEKDLPRHAVDCDLCPMAVYCSTSCRDRDKARHGSTECKMFGAKTCKGCGKTAYNLSECSQCNDAWYCTRTCQLNDWPTHKKTCNQVVASIKSMMARPSTVNSQKIQHSPYYLGNTMAEDFLKLEDNEWSGKDQPEEELTKDYHVLSAGCGNLRSTVLTAASLPDEYLGKLHVTLDDFDPFVMARNVLFLFMLVRFADIDGIASSLTTIWYSLHISKREYDLIKTSLDELIQMSAQQLHDVTQGLVCVKDADLICLQKVWKGWLSLECGRDKRTSINLRQQRKAMYEKSGLKNDWSLYLRRLSPRNKEALTKWFDHAVFLPTESGETDLRFDNATFTGRGDCTLTPLLPRMAPEDCSFVYCLDPGIHPFMEWDCLRVRESTPTPCSSPMVMYHNYVTNLLQKVKSLILQGRLLIHISLADCLDFPSHHQDLQMPSYDRIFTSNLADYLGFARLLQTFKPLLNTSNVFSAIVTATIKWFKSEIIPAADMDNLKDMSECFRLFHAYCFDTNKSTATTDFCEVAQHLREYYNNTSQFVQFLRADIMAGGPGIQALKDVPSLNSVKKYHGMQMRNFRKALNKLVPFQFRENARDLNVRTGCQRAVEWCLPSNGGVWDEADRRDGRPKAKAASAN